MILRKFNFKRLRGFTLAEMLVVVLIISILAAVAVPLYNRTLKRSRVSDAIAVLSEVAAKQEAIYTDKGDYAADFDELEPPVKGLKGSGGVKLGAFNYYMDNTCVAAVALDYKILKNYKTTEIACAGQACAELKGILFEGSAGCNTSLGG